MIVNIVTIVFMLIINYYQSLKDPYTPINFVRKMNGTLRMCIDYRPLNQQIRLDKYPLPRIDDLLDQLVNAHCLISIDLHID